MKRFIVIAGPTGSGKSDLAMRLAVASAGEIVSCDSVQLYRGFDIGSAKPTRADQQKVPHHLIDRLDWNENCDAGLYAKWANATIDDILSRGRTPIVVGGTGLYLRALLGNGWNGDLPKDDALRAELEALPTEVLWARLTELDPGRASELHRNDRFRVVRSLELVTLLGKPLKEAGLAAESPADPRAMVVVLRRPRALMHARIEARTQAMVAVGLVDEVRALLARGVNPECKPMGSIGYKQAVAHLRGEMTASALVPAIQAATRQYAKRQDTWNRKVKADLVHEGDGDEAILAACAQIFSRP